MALSILVAIDIPEEESRAHGAAIPQPTLRIDTDAFHEAVAF
jgi:hypothetical protein